MKVLLVANYEIDGQESMLRFADALTIGLKAAGIGVEVVRPAPFFGRCKPGSSGFGKWLGYLDKFLLFPRQLHRAATAADLVHIVDHSNAMYRTEVANQPHLITCNDMLAIRSARGEFVQNRTGLTGRILQGWILSHLRRAQRLTCISEATQKDVLRLTGQPLERVGVTWMGLNHGYTPTVEVAVAAETRRRGGNPDVGVFSAHALPPSPYLLHVGGTQWYKNRAGVIAMHSALQKRLGDKTPRLIIVGRPDALSAGEAEYRTGVSHAELSALYSGAEALLFPSLEEGFGWPIIEAQACGCPVITTSRPPMTEVGGEAALYLADPTDAEAGADRIAELLSREPAERNSLIEQGFANAARFTTEQMVNEYIDLYRKVIADRHAAK